jgi:uncharacterized protein YkwD
VTRPQWQSSPNVAPPAGPDGAEDRGTWQTETTAEWQPGDAGPVDEPASLYSGRRRYAGDSDLDSDSDLDGGAGRRFFGDSKIRRPGPVVIAAIVAGVLVVFGLSALVIPPMLSGGSNTTATGGNAAGAAPPPAAETSTEPTAEPSTGPSADVSPTASAKASPTAAVAGNARLEEQVLALVNNERRRARCDAVRMDERLRTAARTHSADMAQTNRVDQTGSDGSSPLDRMRKAGYPQGLAEILARGDDSAQEVVRNWLRDRSDRNAILDCDAKAIGVGVALRGRTPFWTLDTGRV